MRSVCYKIIRRKSLEFRLINSFVTAYLLLFDEPPDLPDVLPDPLLSLEELPFFVALSFSLDLVVAIVV